MSDTKRCSTCGEVKPRSDFYVAHKATATRKAKIAAKCKDCTNTRQREFKQDQPRINRNRARHRAVAALIEAHQAEFEALYEHHLELAADEADALAREKAAREHYKGEPVRLRPGRRRAGEKAGDRIDVARCPHCIRHHDRGHVCAVCGATPEEAAEPPRWQTTRDVDEVAVDRAINGDRSIARNLGVAERGEAIRRLRKRGMTIPQIAEQLCVTTKTVERRLFARREGAAS